MYVLKLFFVVVIFVYLYMRFWLFQLWTNTQIGPDMTYILWVHSLCESEHNMLKWRVRRGRSRAVGHSRDGFKPSQVLELEPESQPKFHYHVEDEVSQNAEEDEDADDDVHLHDVEEPVKLDSYPKGPSDVSVFIQYAHHVAKHTWDGEVRYSNFCAIFLFYFIWVD